MRIKLFTKFVLILVLLAVIPAAIVGLRTTNINREGMQAAILELHTHIATYLADDVQKYLKGLEREIQYILRTLSARLTWADRQSVLQALLDTNENFVSVSIVDRKGKELLKAYNPSLEKNPQLVLHDKDEAFNRFWSHPENSALSEVYFVNNEPRINIIYPLGLDHCLYTTVTLQSLWDGITQTRIASTGYAFLVNEKGEIIAHPQVELAMAKTLSTNLPIVDQVLKSVTVGSSEYTHPNTGKKIVGAYAPVKGLRWGVIIQQDKDEAYVSVNRMRRQAFLLILIAVFAAAALAYAVARSLTRPIEILTDAARHIANKDFSHRVRVQTNDELHDLADTFNEMTTELERYDQMQVDKIVEEKTKTEAVIFSITDGILMTDREGRLQVANDQARAKLSLPEADWQGKPLTDFVQNQSVLEAFKNIPETDRKDRTKEVDLSVGDLSRYYLLSTGEVITQEKKEKIGFVAVLRNITLEKELDRMKDDFLHSITHDLRNPMTSVRGFLKFLLDGVGGPLTPEQKKMLETMDRASHRLLILINDILDIAKLEAGRMTLNLSETDLRNLAQKNLEIAEGSALKKSIKLNLQCSEQLPRIWCDAELIERVFSNLISNALKFTPENGSVTVAITELVGELKVAVIDTGEGIPPEYLNKIFDKFQQVAGQRRGGTGLGLTICKHIVESHLGKIWVESKLTEGSHFIFTLPRTLTAAMLQNSPGPSQHS
jgi:NtrC-family two-component system sensor histidine kinase KinB